MTHLNRRHLLSMSARSLFGLSLRSVITGLPVAFLTRGEARANTLSARIAILASSSSGEPLNVCGPGTFEPGQEAFFDHPTPGAVDAEDLGAYTVNGTLLTPEHLATSAELTLGDQRVRMARCFESLEPSMLERLVWFNYSTRANIHPQYSQVLTAYGSLRGAQGRGAEQLPAAIAYETAPLLNTTMRDPFIIGNGSFTAGGSPLANYSPTKVKALANNVGGALGGAENFGVLYDHFIDETYGHIRQNGTAQQRRFLDQHASSRRQASIFGERLGELLSEINDDSVESQLKTAAVIAKLRIAPVVVTNFEFGGDNHQDAGLTNETEETLRMIKALDSYWKSINAFNIVDDVFYANLDVFGRTPTQRGSGGRGHYGAWTSGTIIGGHLSGGVVGGISLDGSKAVASGINTTTGSDVDPNISPEDTLTAYYKTLMRVAGVPSERRDVRLPTGQEVTSFV